VNSRAILAVDIGNTSAHFAFFPANGKKREFRVKTSDVAEAGGSIRKNIPPGVCPDVVIASVVPAASILLKKTVARLGYPVFILGKDLQVPITNRYKNPRQVGLDRLLNGYAAYAEYPQELIIIDFGTAITFDLISKKGEYLGGIIAPGIEITLEALFQKTALLPRIKLAHPASLIGRDTTESIRIGCSVGIGGLCDRIVDELRKHHLKNAKVIATGGYARFMKRYCRAIDKIDDDLVLKGILKTYRYFLQKQQ